MLAGSLASDVRNFGKRVLRTFEIVQVRARGPKVLSLVSGRDVALHQDFM
jgi:hypothetical protein